MVFQLIQIVKILEKMDCQGLLADLGMYPQGERSITFTLGGGYYFIPPIPNKKISDISEQFFT